MHSAAAPHSLPVPSRIAVFGETLLDLFDAGPVVGGAPFNVARHLSAFGCAPLMLTAIGCDAHAAPVHAEFDRYRMRREGLQQLADRPTGVVDVHTTADGGHRFAIRGACAYDFIGSDALLAMEQCLAPQGWLYYGTLALRSPVSLATWRGLVAAHRGPRYLDLNWRAGHIALPVALEAIAACDVLKVNDEELAMVCAWAGFPAPETPGDLARLESVDRVQTLLGHFGLRLLIVTCGADGYLAFDAQGGCLAQGRNQRPLALVDSVGAGDSFSAVVLAGLLDDWPLPLALQRADAFAGHICEVRGAVPADLDAYARWTEDWPLIAHKIAL